MMLYQLQGVFGVKGGERMIMYSEFEGREEGNSYGVFQGTTNS
jgi:hypothetical protein